MTEKLPTGVDILDRKLDGGVAPGQIVALSAAPASQSERLLYEFVGVRPTLYLSTLRSPSAVRETVERFVPESSEVVVAGVDDQAPFDDARPLLEVIPDGANVVVDPIEVFEWQNVARYRKFLIDLRDRLDATDGVAVLHCLDSGPDHPARTVTEFVADVVFELSTERDGSAVETHLSVPKCRGGQPLDEVFKLNVTNRVNVDTSRNIV